jgi:hypothetical protein
MKQLDLPGVEKPNAAAIREYVRRKLYGLEYRQAARQAKRKQINERAKETGKP